MSKNPERSGGENRRPEVCGKEDCPTSGRSPQEQVLDHAFSRNRHFEWYENEGKKVLSFRRIVQGLLAGLEHCEPQTLIYVEQEGRDGCYWLSLQIPKYRVSHRCCLLEPEFRAIQTHPQLGARLAFKDSSS